MKYSNIFLFSQFHNQIVPPLFRYIDHGRGLVTLRIDAPTTTDSGKYTCKIITDAGSCRSTNSVRIVENSQAPKTGALISSKPESITAVSGSVVSFTVQVADNVQHVQWFICGREVFNCDRGILVSDLYNNNKNECFHIIFLFSSTQMLTKCVLCANGQYNVASIWVLVRKVSQYQMSCG